MDELRLGIIGMGNMGRYHAEYLSAGRVQRCRLVAVCDPSDQTLERYGSLLTFTDGEELIRSGRVDAVLIATPHFQHAPLGIAALRAGVHVMVEKPIASHKADAERLVDAHADHPHLVFAGMFQLRTEPRYLRIRGMIEAGELGELVRVNWINTDWFRTEAYFASSAWRATWKGEGGGVLLNQCLHNLDVLQWLFGMPRRLRGFCQLGRFHDIEVEDDVTAYLEWPSGATGTFIGSTGEAPGTNRLEIVGTRAAVVLENDRLTIRRNEQDMRQFSRAAAQPFAKPEMTVEQVPLDNAEHPHAAMVQNFVNAILDGEPLIAPGEDGIQSVELANAIVFSSLLGETIELPMDALAWERRLAALIASSSGERVVSGGAFAHDLASSFRR